MIFKSSHKRPFEKVAVFFLMTFMFSGAQAGVGGASGMYPANPEMMTMKEHSVRVLRPDKDGKLIAYCSGIIQNSGEVITAGHCLKGHDSKKLYVEVYDKNAKKYQRFSVLKRSYISDFDNAKVDLGIATFLPNPKMGLPNKSLPIADAGCDAGSKVYTSGFGLSESGRTGELRINEYELADAIDTPVLNGEVFLKSKSGRTCFGDSGGPVFCKSKGILSILAISSNIYHPMSVGEVQKTPQFCRSIQYLRSSDINSVDKLLQKLRNEEINDSTPVAQ